jgi:two-component system sensor kinase FixL
MSPIRDSFDFDASAQLLAAIVASSDDAIISKTVDGRVTSWNRGAERMFGYVADEMIGGPIAVLALPGREDEMPAILARIRAGERVEHFETERRHKNGASVLVSLSVSPIHNARGEVVGASKVARDISAARQASDALKLAQARLQEQHLELMHAARLGELGQMAATLAHEINQPLSAIKAYLQGSQRIILRDDEPSRLKVQDALLRAVDQTDRAGEVVRRLRQFAKPNDGVQSRQSIDQILEDAAMLATLDAGQRGVTVDLNPRLGQAMVMADRIEIQQVLMNLIRNAIEAMEGQPRCELQLGARQASDAIEVSVSDTGPGLPSDVRERLFTPFVTTKPNGMGIGLSICRKIIEGHGGRLWAEDNVRGGTTFRFTLQAA